MRPPSISVEKKTSKMLEYEALNLSKIIGPFFFSEKIIHSANKYQNLLEICVIPQLPESIVFQ